MQIIREDAGAIITCPRSGEELTVTDGNAVTNGNKIHMTDRDIGLMKDVLEIQDGTK
jgi:hypothetical protein